MKVTISETPQEMARIAASRAANVIETAIRNRGRALIVLATGASQLEMLSVLTRNPAVDWTKVEAFHLDEYIDIDPQHPASFRRYLRERFVDRVGQLSAFHEIRGDAADPDAECARLVRDLGGRRIDLCLVGIGENAHLAFNDPPADFETDAPYLIVELDEPCRQQQFGEGWFPSITDVPRKAISMSVRQILSSENIVATVPDLRKAVAVRCSVDGPVSPACPASILQTHPRCELFLESQSASLLARTQEEHS
jgi:glucosamine-6-phosphate deaminase